MADEKKNLPEELETISELVEGAAVFDSNGYSKIKVTRNGEEKFIKLPIRSAGVDEFKAGLSQKAPRPPVTRELIKKNSPEGKELGLPHNTVVQVFDRTDEAYVESLNAHNDEVSWRVAVFALNLNWKKADGTTAETFEEKKKILQGNGITFYQMQKIYSDIVALTAYAEEREDFLSGN